MRVRNWQSTVASDGRDGPEIECEALVDSGALQTALPADLIEALDLMDMGRARVRTADGVIHYLRLMGIAEVAVQGRLWYGRVIELPRGAQPLLGAMTMEEMDWHISPRERKLVPRPSSPDLPEVPLLVSR